MSQYNTGWIPQKSLSTLIMTALLFLACCCLFWSKVHATISTGTSDLVQFTASGHVLGFESERMYVASGDHVLRVEFVGTDGVRPVVDQMPTSDGHALPLECVDYPELWPGISLRYEAISGGIVQSSYILEPGADVSRIRLRYNALVEIEAGGSLRIGYENGWMNESAPVAWQEIDGQKIPVTVAFSLYDSSTKDPMVGFSLGRYNLAYPLMIDPTLSWNTFLGSAADDEAYTIAMDGNGNVYVAGWSTATWGSSPVNAFTVGASDGFVAKLNSIGVLQWNTFMGGESVAYVTAITVDGSGNVYVAGDSYSTWGSSPVNAYSGTYDAFAAKLNSSGVLQWNTFMGSAALDYARSIAVDSSENLYVAGSSQATWGSSPVNAYSGDYDAFAAKLNNSGVLQWNTFIGSAVDEDDARGIAVDDIGNVYVAGISYATWGPSPVDVYSGNSDAFAAKLNSSGALQWNTFMGSADYDFASGIAVDGSGNVYVAGSSHSTWGSSPVNAYSEYYDGFAAKLNSSGVLQWNTFMGSADYDSASALTMDDSGNIYVAGSSDGTWGSSPVYAYSGHREGFAAKLNNSGVLQWNTFMGSAVYDEARGIAVDGIGNVYVAGISYATWGPSPVDAYSGSIEAFVVRLGNTENQQEGYDLMAMGDNGYGQLGATNTNRRSPVDITTSVLRVAAGYNHSLFIKIDGTLWAVGANDFGQLGDGTTTDRSTPVQVATDVSQVAAGDNYSLFVKNDGTLWAMGANDFGQLGAGWIPNYSTPVQVATSVSRVAVKHGMGAPHSLFVKHDGTLWAMGANDYGQLGDGTTTSTSTPIQVATNVSQVSAGGDYNSGHSLFVKTDGTLWAMGDNSYGQLGDGTTTSTSTPIQVATNVSQVVAGGTSNSSHSLFVKTDGTLWGVGSGTSGQLGNGYSDAATPILIAADVSQAAACAYQSLFVKTDGTLWAMGDNHYGQLGVGTTGGVYGTPIQVATNVSQVAAGYNHSLFRKTDGTLWAMGDNSRGQLGDGTTSYCGTPVQAAVNVSQAAAGRNHSLFVKTDGMLWAMGHNGYGQLGDGTTTSTITPTQVAADVSQVAAGDSHSLYVKIDGTLWAMGLNQWGALGVDTPSYINSTPIQVAADVSQATAGAYHSLFVKTDGTLSAMGHNSYSQLGDGTTTSTSTPIQVATNVSQVAAGLYHSLFVKNDGTLWAMGYNGQGQLGDGTTTSTSTPIQVATDVSQVTAGDFRSLFVKADGTLWITGYNSTTTNYTPRQVATNVSQVAAGLYHSLFVKNDGTLWAMGDNFYGQLGDGTTTNANTPIQVATNVSQVTAGSSSSLFLQFLDSDNDGLPDTSEQNGCTDPFDADSDDDGISDGTEDADRNGIVDTGETDPCDLDTDGDGIQDGTELGVSSAGPDTDAGIFIPDADPSTTTDPLDDDSDNDGILDGEEDANHNGAVDGNETDPLVSNSDSMSVPWILPLLLGD